MKQLPLFFALILSLSSHFALPHLFPSIRFLVMAPFLCLVASRKSLLTALWASALCGLFVDLLSDGPFGQLPLCYSLAMLPYFLCKKSLRTDGIFSLVVHTTIFSFFISILSLLFSSFRYPLQSAFLMPLLDGIFAFFSFTCPQIAFTVLSRRELSRKKRGQTL